MAGDAAEVGKAEGWNWVQMTLEDIGVGEMELWNKLKPVGGG